MPVDGYFSAPHSSEHLVVLAQSEDPMERWAAASLLGQYDSETRVKILSILRSETDSLVLSALQVSSEGSRQPPTSFLGEQDKISGGFLEAFGTPIGPSMRRELSGWTLKWAWESFSAEMPKNPAPQSFPQANSIPKMVEMLDQLVDSQVINGTSLGLNERQVSYYISALEFASCISVAPGQKITVMPEVLKQRNIADRLRFVIRTVMGISTVGAAYLMRLQPANKKGFPPVLRAHSDLVEFFKESPDSTGLSGSTLERRVGTAQSWARQIADLLGTTPGLRPT